MNGKELDQAKLDLGMNENGTLGRTIAAGRWSLFGLIFQKIIGLGTFFILARLLAPQDYGVITIVLMLVGVLDTLSVPGFERALIQKKGEIKEYLDVFWTFNLLRAVLIFFLIFLLAPLIGKFFQITDLLALAILRFSGLIILLQALANLGSLFFFKKLDFKNIFIRDTGGQIAFAAVAIGWALFSPSVLALFLGYLAQNASSTLIQYWLSPHRPKLSFYFRRLHDLAAYGAWAMGQGIVSQANSILETAIVGRFLGPSDLGLYSRANSVASLPSSALFSVIYKVGFPAYSRVQDSRERIAGGFLRSFDIAFLTTIPFLILILFAAQDLVQILLGEKWLGMVGAMKILVVALTLEGFSNITYPLLEGIGRPDIRFKLASLQLITALPLLFWLSRYGISRTALAMLLTSALIFLISLSWTFYYLRPGFLRVLAPFFSVLGASAVAILLAFPFYSDLRAAGALYFLLFLSLLGLIYFAVLVFLGRFFKDGPYKTLKIIFSLHHGR
ncbi:MAG: lipopolysaccharide biosynthesis protein [bacterium]|nr:lipopolysaccharide biosynthesis protein [bacterium]